MAKKPSRLNGKKDATRRSGEGIQLRPVFPNQPLRLNGKRNATRRSCRTKTKKKAAASGWQDGCHSSELRRRYFSNNNLTTSPEWQKHVYSMPLLKTIP